MSSRQSDHIVEGLDRRQYRSTNIKVILGPKRGCAGAIRSRWASVMAKLNPADRDVADIGDELAVGRALADLARRLMCVTAHDIEAVTNQPVTVAALK